MNLLREIAVGVLAVACVVALGLLIGGGETTLTPACVLFAAVLIQAGMSQGPLAGGATGLAAAAGLLLLRQAGGGAPDVFLYLAAAGLPALGLIFGSALAARKLGAEQAEQAGVELRRELYRLKKEFQGSRRPDPPGRVNSAPEQATSQEFLDTDLLLSVMARIASSLIEHRVIEATLDSVRDLLGVEQACFHLHERGTDSFLPGRGLQPSESELPVGENESVLQLARARRELLARDSDDQRVAQAFSVARPEIQLAVPVFDRAMLTGVLLTSRPERLSEDSRRLLGVLAAASGLALSAARLVVQSEDQRRRDTLTGLIDLEAVRSLLDDSLSRGPVAVLLVAADGMQKVNEEYGRRAGDKVVAALSRLVSMEIGSAGQVGRYGGATLLVVLSGHRLEAAQELAARLRRRVPLSLHAGPEGLARELTISVGVAAASAGSVDMLTHAAEQSLVVDQQAGRPASTVDIGTGRDLHARP